MIKLKKKKEENEFWSEIPLGLGMALSRNPVAMTRFANLSQKQQDDVIKAAHEINTKKQMRDLAQAIADNRFFG